MRKVLNKNIEDEELLTEALAREEQELSEREIQIRKLKEKRDKDLQVNLLRETYRGNLVQMANLCLRLEERSIELH